MTVKDPMIVLQCLRTKGRLEDMQVMRVYSYKGLDAEAILFALFHDVAYDDMATSPYVREAKLLFDYPKITKAGLEYLEFCELILKAAEEVEEGDADVS